MGSTSEELAKNLAHVRQRIDQAASRAGRSADEITLIAVTKTHSAQNIEALYEAGARHFGENRVQERESKLPQLAGINATWHMIGHLQKNKAARATRLFNSVDSGDSAALAEKLDRAMAELIAETDEGAAQSSGSQAFGPPNRLRVLIEVKLDPEPAKSGVAAEDVQRLAEAILQMPHLDLKGLMGVPPYFAHPEEARPYFSHLREIRDEVRARAGTELLPVLSMGMSHDFEIAIEEGATEIRVGTALFGDRDKA